MFSLTLRRKSAPGLLDSPEKEPTKRSTPPSKSSRNRSRSLSSKGSLSSLFSSSRKTQVLVAMDPAEHVDAVEADNYPPYDVNNPDHNPESSSRPVTPTTPSALRKSGSKTALGTDPAPRNWLDSIAMKLRAATELFHKGESPDRENTSPSSKFRSVRGRSVSPKKSVRFRSGTFSGESATATSPIDVPTKSTPLLPALKLPTEGFLCDVTQTSNQDPVPTARPDDTPYLKSQAAHDYFFPFPTEIDNKLDDLKQQRDSPDVPQAEATDTPACIEESNPFDDSAEISQPLRSEAEGMGSQDNTNTLQTKQIDDTTEWKHISPSKPPEESYHLRIESESNVTNPFIASSETFLNYCEPERAPPSSSTPPSRPTLQVEGLFGVQGQTPRVSPWTLNSRTDHNVCVDLGTDSESDDAGESFPKTRGRYAVTHEDIRQKFRPLRRGAVVVEDGKAPPPLTPFDASEPVKCSSPSISTQAPVTTVSDINATAIEQDSSLNLQANVSSTSPPQSRRTFRFSNTSPGNSSASEITPTQLGWEGHKLTDRGRDIRPDYEERTPSPVSIPLPLSIQAKGCRSPVPKWRDQHGWTPFDEQEFASSMLQAYSEGHELVLLETGGFAKLWLMHGLPVITRPEDDTKALSLKDINDLLQYCKQTQWGKPGSNLETNGMSDLFSPHVSSNINYFSSLSSTDDCGAITMSTIYEAPSDAASSKTSISGAPLRRFDHHPTCSHSSAHGSSSSDSAGCSDASCSLCRRRYHVRSGTDGLESSVEWSLDEDTDFETHDGALSEGRNVTPTRRNVTSNDPTTLKDNVTTPKQKLFTSRQLPYRLRSTTSTDESTAFSEDERYAKNIV